MKVSVAVITYNHAAYIAQALDGVLAQDTTFPFEVVVADDCSTDATRDIVQAYADGDARVRLLDSTENLGMMPNFVRLLEACEGEYVALLDGDDYWTDPRKLQIQSDFLDAHPECAICHHDVMVVDDDEPAAEGRRFNGDEQPAVTTIEDLFERNYVATCAAMFRRANVDPLPGWLSGLRVGDHPVHILNAAHGCICYLDRVMGVYRFHPGGTWNAQSLVARLDAWVESLETLDRHFGGRYRPVVAHSIYEARAQAAKLRLEAGDAPGARFETRSALRAAVAARPCPVRAAAQLAVQTYAPGAVGLYRRVRYGART